MRSGTPSPSRPKSSAPAPSAKEREAVLKAALVDPRMWLPFVVTKDEHDEKTPFKRLPLRENPYLLHLTRLWMEEQQMVILKSRQLLVTWLFVSLYAWDAATKKARLTFFVSKKEEDGKALVRRAQFVLEHMPAELRPTVTYTHPVGGPRILIEPSGSEIRGIPQGADQLRSYTASAVLLDEFAFQDRQEEAYEAIRPTLDGGGKATIISTPNGPGNFFYRLYRGDL